MEKQDIRSFKSKPLQQFIRDSQQDQLSIQEQLSEIKLQQSKHQQIQVHLLQSGFNQTFSGLKQASENPISIQDQYKKQDLNFQKELIQLFNKESWITLFVQEHLQDVKNVLKKSWKQKGISEDDLKSLVAEFIKASQLRVSDQDLKSLIQLLENQCRENYQVSFQDFISIIYNWADQKQHISLQYQNSLLITINQFRNLPNIKSLRKLKQDVIQGIQNLLSTYKLNKKIHREAFDRSVKEYLLQVFQYYAISTISFGKKPTFQSIQSNNSTWSLPKFLKFCKDYKINLKKPLSLQILTQIFKSSSTNGRTMKFSQLLDSLDKISQILYQNHSFFLSDRRNLLVKQLKQTFQKRNPRKKSQNQIRSKKVTPSFQVSEQMEKNLQNWHNKHKVSQLIQQHRSKSVPKIRKLYIPKQGYTKRSRIPKLLSQKKLLQSRSVSKMDSNKPLTFRNINDLEVPDLGFQFSDDDQYLQNLYGKISDIQNSRLARGLKVVKKFNYPLKMK